MTTNEEKIDALERASVSNRVSAVINQGIGALVGCILLYIGFYLNFQDNTRDILILSMMGYGAAEIRKMLLDIYKPLLWSSFFLTLWPAIVIVKGVLRSLSFQIGEYLPFQTNALVVAGIFVLLNIVYYLVSSTFRPGVRNLLKKQSGILY